MADREEWGQDMTIKLGDQNTLRHNHVNPEQESQFDKVLLSLGCMGVLFEGPIKCPLNCQSDLIIGKKICTEIVKCSNTKYNDLHEYRVKAYHMCIIPKHRLRSIFTHEI